jgi:hypothetical protein
MGSGKLIIETGVAARRSFRDNLEKIAFRAIADENMLGLSEYTRSFSFIFACLYICQDYFLVPVFCSSPLSSVIHKKRIRLSP